MEAIFKNMKPKVSVIMSVFNGQAFLGESIDSILSQTLKDLEFIIINDASTDSTAEILTSYSDPRIKIVSNTENLGLTKSLNKALKTAQGEYIARQDAGDISLANRLDAQYSFLEENKDFFLTGSRVIKIDRTGKESTKPKLPVSENALKQRLLKENSIFHPAIMFRNTNKLFYRKKFKYAQDYDLYLLLLSQGKRMINLPDFLVKYRLDSGSISFSKRIQQALFAQKALEFYKQRLLCGTDKYDAFEPDEITLVDINNLQDKKLLRYEIEALFEINKFKKVRKVYKDYFRNTRLVDEYMLYYLVSFLPRKLIDLLRLLRCGIGS
jgi:glycosyltransferase involved in cell wall biosynthesis